MSVHGLGGLTTEVLNGREHAPLTSENGGGPPFGPVRVPHGHYLVLGDNAVTAATDDRSAGVARQSILGRAAAVCVRHGRPVCTRSRMVSGPPAHEESCGRNDQPTRKKNAVRPCLPRARRWCRASRRLS